MRPQRASGPSCPSSTWRRTDSSAAWPLARHRGPPAIRAPSHAPSRCRPRPVADGGGEPRADAEACAELLRRSLHALGGTTLSSWVRRSQCTASAPRRPTAGTSSCASRRSCPPCRSGRRPSTRSPCSTALAGSLRESAMRQQLRTGFLTMEQTRKLVCSARPTRRPSKSRSSACGSPACSLPTRTSGRRASGSRGSVPLPRGGHRPTAAAPSCCSRTRSLSTTTAASPARPSSRHSSTSARRRARGPAQDGRARPPGLAPGAAVRSNADRDGPLHRRKHRTRATAPDRQPFAREGSGATLRHRRGNPPRRPRPPLPAPARHQLRSQRQASRCRKGAHR